MTRGGVWKGPNLDDVIYEWPLVKQLPFNMNSLDLGSDTGHET